MTLTADPRLLALPTKGVYWFVGGMSHASPSLMARYLGVDLSAVVLGLTTDRQTREFGDFFGAINPI